MAFPEAGVLSVQLHEVCKELFAVKPSHGPDNVPRRIVKEFAHEVAEGNHNNVLVTWHDSDISAFAFLISLKLSIALGTMYY